MACCRWLEFDRSDETEEVVPVPEFEFTSNCCFSTVDDDDVMAANDGRDTLVGSGREGLITVKGQ